MKFGLAPTTIMIFMFVPSIGVRSSAFHLPESLLELEQVLDLPLDFVKTQAQTQRLEGTENSRADSEAQQAAFTGSREFLRDGRVVTSGRTAALFDKGRLYFSRALSQTFLSCQ